MSTCCGNPKSQQSMLRKTISLKRSIFRKQKQGTIERSSEILADNYERGATMKYLHTNQGDEINLKASTMAHYAEGNKPPGK
ncbi:hypothetical protein BGAL_0213g00140 [Botrytis galanthina]|uniref:Uncharacterized protein n=1 Tax=Botrytis galanthina TaxID=278940 RepID=A0A4S8QV15_9HELO|nr:hypothetical protein BGAL_0213g00140 [Botrytis galanthina]